MSQTGTEKRVWLDVADRSKRGILVNLFDDQLTLAELTMRERQILELAACGMSAKQIAQDVGIAPRTVERHVENVRHKLRARNKTHMIAKAVALGLLYVERRPVPVEERKIWEFDRKLVANE